ncbi:hypothetical protein EVAR_25295_1 [Eumeta japonica]|uniref:Uncharacterized protein n=1 Tax=Eumeta variegata TaxID=151549 RepID=A0A4C1VP42_EUMVA|nr:hypothetical protein EVAR_25295_1 [Eumeta japonica]
MTPTPGVRVRLLHGSSIALGERREQTRIDYSNYGSVWVKLMAATPEQVPFRTCTRIDSAPAARVSVFSDTSVSLILIMSALYKIKRSSPRIDPCSTPRVTADREERDTEPLPLRTSTN